MMPPRQRQTDICSLTGKLSHRHYSAAQAAVKGHLVAMLAKGEERDGHMQIYRCKACGGFHLGTSSDDLARSARRRKYERAKVKEEHGTGE